MREGPTQGAQRVLNNVGDMTTPLVNMPRCFLLMVAEISEDSRVALCVDSNVGVLEHQYQWYANVKEKSCLLYRARSVAQLVVTCLCIMHTAI